MDHAYLMHGYEYSQEVFNMIAAHGYKKVFWLFGTWGDPTNVGTFTYWMTESNIPIGVQRAHAIGLEILGVDANTYGYQTTIDVEDYALVDKIASATKTIIAQKGLDGWVDGTENFSGSIANFIRFINVRAQAVHSIGKKFLWANQAWKGMSETRWTMYDYATDADATTPMFYDHVDPPNFEPCINRVLNSYPGSVLVGFAFRCTQQPPTGYTLADELAMLDRVLNTNPNKSKVTGVHTYFRGSPLSITSQEWNYWDSWLASQGEQESVLLKSTPVPVTFTVNGVQYPSGTTLQVPRGSILNISVPGEVLT